MITKIHLKNWRSHLDTSLEFTQGTNALLGPMGSGKSSIMNAICFALFGTFPDLQSRKVKIDDIIMSRPLVKQDSQIIVDFISGGNTYSVMRVVERKKGTTYSELRQGDKLLEAPNAQRVTETIEKILKMDYELFTRAIYSEQNGLDYFLRLPRGERMKKIDNLLMIDKFETARTNAVSLKNRLSERKTAIESLLTPLMEEELKKSIEDIGRSIEKLIEEKRRAEMELQEKTSKKIILEKEIREIERLDKELRELKFSKNSIEASLKEIEEFIKKFDMKESREKYSAELDSLSTILKGLQAKISEKKNEQEALAKKIANSQARLQFANKSLDELRKKISERHAVQEKLSKMSPENLYTRLKQEKELMEKLEREFADFRAKTDQIRDSLDRISKVENKCPVCESEIDEKKRQSLMEDYKSRILKYEQESSSLKERIDAQKLIILNLETAQRDLEISMQKLKESEDLEKEAEILKKEMKESEDVLRINSPLLEKIKREQEEIEREIEKTIYRKQEVKTQLEKLCELEENQEKKKKFLNDLKSIEEKIALLDQNIGKKDIDLIRKEFTENIAREAELAARIRGLNNVIQEKESRLKENKTKIENLEKQKEEMERLERLVRNLSIFENALEKTQSQLRENFIQTVNYTMEQIWPEIYPYQDFKNARLSIKERDYVLQLQNTEDEWIDVDGIASGGERSIASLVLRIAFSSVLAPQLKWLILDEPTHNLDSKAIEDLSEALRNRIADFVEQVFLITHERQMENAVTGQLYRLSRNKEMNDFTRVEKIN